MKNMPVGDIKPKEDDDVQVIEPPSTSHAPQDEIIYLLTALF
jgi:hypothetical protein